jgi:hypothetical protein
MRLFAIAILLSGAVGLSGCGSTPVDPYSDMRMLTPAEAGVTGQDEDPVQQAERANNAKFAPIKKRAR